MTIFQRLVVALIAVFTTIVIGWSSPATAALPPGNAIKDPYAILRTALPIEQKELREIQYKLEETTELLRGSRWQAINKASSRSLFLLTSRKDQILQSMSNDNKKEAEKIMSTLKISLENLDELASEKDKVSFINERRTSLKKIGQLEALLVGKDFTYQIPEEFKNLPRLLGRATVEINTSKGLMTAIVDGYNAPLTAGAFIDLTLKGFYDGLPFAKAEDFYILQTGDPEGPEAGYIDPETNKERNVPLEIRAPGIKETIYNETFEEMGLYTETPVLPFATFGTLGWAHSSKALDDGSSQFFFFLYEAELNPAGRNLIDGRNAAFGYVVEGSEILNNLNINDQIISIKVLDGADRLQTHA